MRIRNAILKERVVFSKLSPGNVFEHETNLYMKMTFAKPKSISAVRLFDGVGISIEDERIVVLVEGEFVRTK